MRCTNLKSCGLFIFILCTFFSPLNPSASDKQNTTFHKPAQIEYDQYILQTGRLHNYVSNSTYTFPEDRNYRTFLIGRNDLLYPSMQWLEGGYPDNHYLYFGAFWITYQGNPIRFSTETSDDFAVTKVSPYDEVVTFSMSDELADTLGVGIKCFCRVHGYTDIARQDVIIYEYDIINQSGDTLSGVYCGLQMDGDISAAGGGSSNLGFWRDDIPDYYLGTDHNGNPESISYMYDGDNPDISGDDTGGRFLPKESLGYLGSRVIKSPPTIHGIPANQQSGNYWWNWSSDPPRSSLHGIMQKEELRPTPGWPHDFRYLQSVGPYDLTDSDTLQIVLAIGVGNGLEGLRKNLQAANDLFPVNNEGPEITDYSPDTNLQILYYGESQTFTVSANPSENNRLIYTWQVDQMFSAKRDSFFVFNSAKFDTGYHDIFVEVSGDRYSSWHYWQVKVEPAKKFVLGNNFPNPFNGMTKIPFELVQSGDVSLIVYDVSGQKVKILIDQSLQFGKHEAVWDGRDDRGNMVSTGVYFYQLSAISPNGGNLIQTNKLLYIK